MKNLLTLAMIGGMASGFLNFSPDTDNPVDDDFGQFQTAPVVATPEVVETNSVPSGEVIVEVTEEAASTPTTENAANTDNEDDDNDDTEEDDDDEEKLLSVKKTFPRKPRGSSDDAEKVGSFGVEITVRIPLEEADMEKFNKGLALDRKTTKQAKIKSIIEAIPNWKDKSKEEQDALLQGVQVEAMHSITNLIQPFTVKISDAIKAYSADQQTRTFPTRGTGDTSKLKEMRDSAITMLQSSLGTIIAFTAPAMARNLVFKQVTKMPAALRKSLVPTLEHMREGSGLDELFEVGAGISTKEQLVEKIDDLLSIARVYAGYVEAEEATANDKIMAHIASL